MSFNQFAVWLTSDFAKWKHSYSFLQSRKIFLCQRSTVSLWFFNWIFTKLQVNVRKSLTFSFVCCAATSAPWDTGAAPGSSEHHNVSSTWLDFTVLSGRSSFSSFSSSLNVGGACAGFTFSCKIRTMLVTQNWWLYIKSVCCCGMAESQFACCRGLGHWQHTWLLLFSSHGTFWLVTFNFQYYEFLNLVEECQEAHFQESPMQTQLY